MTKRSDFCDPCRKQVEDTNVFLPCLDCNRVNVGKLMGTQCLSCYRGSIMNAGKWVCDYCIEIRKKEDPKITLTSKKNNRLRCPECGYCGCADE